jgi:putative RecB family exonuclease
MSEIYSHSRLSTFENCRKKFEFRYLLDLPEDGEGIEAFVGKRVHEVLERLYEFVGRGQTPRLERVIDRYNANFDAQYDPERIRIVKSGLDKAFYRALGVRCLSNFYRRHYPFDADETLGLEQRVRFDLDPAGEYAMQGIVDRIVRARDGAIEIQDYKTGSWVPNQSKLDEDRQLALYQIGVAAEYGSGEPIRLVWHYLAKDRICSSTRTPEELETLKTDVIALIDEIRGTQEFPAKKNALCDWCGYKSLCPAFDGKLPDAPSKTATAATPQTTTATPPPPPTELG